MIFRFKNNSIVKAQDIFEDLPDFVYKADVIFTDLPYNQALLTNYSNRKEALVSEKNTKKWDDFQNRFFSCVDEIKPRLLFVEIGKQKLKEIVKEVSKRYKYVKVYNSTYYKKHPCFIVQGSNENVEYPIEWIDEQYVIEWICKNIDFNCICDLCMGQGLVGFYAWKYNKTFCGIELNEKRLSVLKERIEKGKI